MRELSVEPLDLSSMTSVVWRLMKKEQELYVDLDRFHAPRESVEIVSRATREELLIEFARCGWQPSEFLEELRERTSNRWTYVSGLDPFVSAHVLDRERVGSSCTTNRRRARASESRPSRGTRRRGSSR